MKAAARGAAGFAAAAVVVLSGWGWAAERQAADDQITQRMHDSAVQVEQRQACLRDLAATEMAPVQEWDPRC